MSEDSTSVPQTLPTPIHVIVFPTPSNIARLITTPRLPRRPSWHSRTSVRGLASATAPGAERLPSPRVPRPARDRGRPAPRSSCDGRRNGRRTRRRSRDDRARPPSPLPIRRTRGLLSTPFRRRNRRPVADGGFDLEFVHQTAHAGKPKAEPARRGVGVLHRPFDIGDPGAAIAGHDGDSASVPAVHRLESNLSVCRVRQHVPRQLRDRGGNSDDVGGGKAELGRECAPFLPRDDDVAVRTYRHADLTRGSHRFHHAPIAEQETRQPQRRRSNLSR